MLLKFKIFNRRFTKEALNYASLFYFRFHLRKEYYVSYRRLICQQHYKTVDSDAETGRRGHSVFKCPDKILVYLMCFLVSLFSHFYLRFKTLSLIYRVVQFRKSVAYFSAGDVALKSFNDSFLGSMLLGKRRKLQRIIDYVCRLDKFRLNRLAEYFVYQLSLCLQIFDVNSEFLLIRMRKQRAH